MFFLWIREKSSGSGWIRIRQTSCRVCWCNFHVAMPEVVGPQDDLEEVGPAAPNLVDTVGRGQHPLGRHQNTFTTEISSLGWDEICFFCKFKLGPTVCFVKGSLSRDFRPPFFS